MKKQTELLSLLISNKSSCGRSTYVLHLSEVSIKHCENVPHFKYFIIPSFSDYEFYIREAYEHSLLPPQPGPRKADKLGYFKQL